MSKVEQVRMPWASLRRACEAIIRELDAEPCTLSGVSLHGIAGGEVRLAYTNTDGRRDMEFPGVLTESDENWYEPPDG